jgi:hypothetical protein
MYADGSSAVEGDVKEAQTIPYPCNPRHPRLNAVNLPKLAITGPLSIH